MPRVPNTRPTVIYWLIDVRPETLAAGWSSGQPFYCGKTVTSLARRLSAHRLDAARDLRRPLCVRLRECGEHVQILPMETVPVSDDWAARERHWIAILRGPFGGVNVADGGSGPAGFVHSAATRARLSVSSRNMSAETRAKISAANKGRKQSAEWIAKRTAGATGRKASPETRAKLVAARKRRGPVSAETRAKIGLASRRQSKESRELGNSKKRGVRRV